MPPLADTTAESGTSVKFEGAILGGFPGAGLIADWPHAGDAGSDAETALRSAATLSARRSGAEERAVGGGRPFLPSCACDQSRGCGRVRQSGRDLHAP